MITGMIFGFVFFFLAIGIVIGILYLLNLQNTLKAAAPENRKMPPANVWLLLIPLFNLYWIFIVVKRISETIIAEYQAKGQPLPTAKPTYASGLTMALTGAISGVASLFTLPETITQIQNTMNGIATVQETTGLSILISIIGMVRFVAWIVHWVQTANFKSKLKMLTNNNHTESEIFSGI